MDKIKLNINIKNTGWGQDFEIVEGELVSENSAKVIGWPSFSSYIKNGDIVEIIKNQDLYEIKKVTTHVEKIVLRIMFKNSEIKQEEMYKEFTDLIYIAEMVTKPFYLLMNIYFPLNITKHKIENILKKISQKIDFDFELV